MCSKLFVSSLLLSLLPGCMESGYLVTSLAGDPVAAGQPAQVAALRYTNHRPTAAAAETVPLRIKGSFTPGNRAKILRAVNEWNVALNGFVRFTIVEDSGASAATAGHSRPWSIMAAQGISPRVVPGPTIALAHTQPLPGSGGLMIIYVDRIGTRDLGSVVLHELDGSAMRRQDHDHGHCRQASIGGGSAQLVRGECCQCSALTKFLPSIAGEVARRAGGVIGDNNLLPMTPPPATRARRFGRLAAKSATPLRGIREGEEAIPTPPAPAS